MKVGGEEMSRGLKERYKIEEKQQQSERFVYQISHEEDARNGKGNK